jgi:hypothetical protein
MTLLTLLKSKLMETMLICVIPLHKNVNILNGSNIFLTPFLIIKPNGLMPANYHQLKQNKKIKIKIISIHLKIKHFLVFLINKLKLKKTLNNNTYSLLHLNLSLSLSWLSSFSKSKKKINSPNNPLLDSKIKHLLVALL